MSDVALLCVRGAGTLAQRVSFAFAQDLADGRRALRVVLEIRRPYRTDGIRALGGQFSSWRSRSEVSTCATPGTHMRGQCV